MDINIQISKTHVFAENFRRKRAAARHASSGTLIVHFTALGMLAVLTDGSEEQPRVKSFLRLDTDTSQKDPDRTKALQDYFSSIGVRSTTRVLAVSSEGVTLRQLVMPNMPGPDLKQAVTWELKKKFFINPEEHLIGLFGVMDLEGDEGPEKLVNVFHVEKKTSAARLAILTELGLSVEAFWPGPLALAKIVGVQSAREDGDMIVVDLASGLVRIMAVQKGLTMMVRSVQIGALGSVLTESAFEKIADEIQKSMDFYETQKTAHPISHLYLVGSGYDVEAMIRLLGGRFPSMKASALDGARYLSDLLSEEQRALLTNHPGLFGEALGSLLIKEETLNLIPDEVRDLNRKHQLDRVMRKLFLMVASVMVFWVAWVGIKGQMVAVQQGYLEKEWNEIQIGKSAFSSIMTEEKNHRVAIKGAIDVPALLKELSRLTPSPIVLESLKYSRIDGTFRLTGVAHDSGNENVKLVTQYVSNLSRLPFFQTVTLGQTMEDTGAGSVRFQVEATTKAVA